MKQALIDKYYPLKSPAAATGAPGKPEGGDTYGGHRVKQEFAAAAT